MAAGDYLGVPVSVQEKLQQQCDKDEEYRNELISWWMLLILGTGSMVDCSTGRRRVLWLL